MSKFVLTQARVKSYIENHPVQDTYYVPTGAIAIEEYAFRGAPFTNIILPRGLKVINQHAFFDCNLLTNINLPKSLTTISSYAFAWCKELKTIDIPDSVKKMGNYIFVGCEQLQNVKLPQNLSSIGTGCFSMCIRLKSIHLPDSITSIGTGAFHECFVLEDINIPKNLSALANSVFYQCYQLKKITFPEGMTTLPEKIIYQAAGLEEVTFMGPIIGIEPFENNYRNGVPHWDDCAEDFTCTCPEDQEDCLCEEEELNTKLCLKFVEYPSLEVLFHQDIQICKRKVTLRTLGGDSMEVTIPFDTTLAKFEQVALEHCLPKLRSIEKDDTLTVDNLELIAESGVILFKN